MKRKIIKHYINHVASDHSRSICGKIFYDNQDYAGQMTVIDFSKTTCTDCLDKIFEATDKLKLKSQS
jgi:hypothetical protein